MNNVPGIVKVAIWLGRALGQAASYLSEFSTNDFGTELPYSVLGSVAVDSARLSVVSRADDLRDAAVRLESAATSGDDVQSLAALVDYSQALSAFVISTRNLVAAINAEINPVTVPNADDRAAVQAMLPGFAMGLINILIASALLNRYPSLGLLLRLLGLMDWQYTPATGTAPSSRPYVLRRLHLERIQSLITNPEKHFRDVSGWGAASFDPESFFNLYREMFSGEVRAAISIVTINGDPVLHDGLLYLRRRSDLTPPGLELGIESTVQIQSSTRKPVSEKWGIEIKGGFEATGGASVTITPPLNVALAPVTGQTSGSMSIIFDRNPSAQPVVLIGGTGLVALTAANIQLGIALDAKWDVVKGIASMAPLFFAEIKRATIAVETNRADGFVSSLLAGAQIKGVFDLGLEWQPSTGLRVKASGGMEAVLPIHATIGIIDLRSVYLALRIQNDGTLAFEGSTELTAKLGPLVVSVNRFGANINLRLRGDADGAYSIFDVDQKLKPPNGVGLSLDASAVVGGGYLAFDVEKEQYSGILYLEVGKTIVLKAIGLLTTRLPGGIKGYSLLIIITAEFPPIQLGFGFALTGVGGLLGVNRTMVLEVLRDGIKNKTLDSVLFPNDPVNNAPRIISDLQNIFPPAEGRFTLGPMAKIIWGGAYPILSVELGILIELPSPVRLALLGKVTLALPKKERPEDVAVVLIKMDIIGTIDFDKREASVYGVLTDSRIAMFALTGGMALRLSWGNNPVFALSIGGFNPRFTPPPGFPLLDRLALQLSYQSPGLSAMLRMQSYLAVTANTLQFGARIDVYVAVSVASVTGFLGFDALVEFHPFHFIVDLYGGVTVRAFNLYFSVDLFLTLSGPKPWLGHGHATVYFLGKHEFPVHFVIGEAAEIPALPPVDPLDVLEAALSDLRNWSAALPVDANMLVTLRQLSTDETKDTVLAHPLGELTVRQNVLPFGVALERFGAAVPTSSGPFEICQFTLGTSNITANALYVVREAFARGQFVNMSEDEKLSSPGFESFPCGQSHIGTEKIKKGSQQSASFEYDVTVIDKKDEKESRSSKTDKDIPRITISSDEFLRGSQFGAAKQTPTNSMGSARFAGTAQGIKVKAPKYVVAGTEDLQAQSNVSFDTYTEAEAARREGDAGMWQVVEMHEAA